MKRFFKKHDLLRSFLGLPMIRSNDITLSTCYTVCCFVEAMMLGVRRDNIH
jgi:hypothetical protein